MSGIGCLGHPETRDHAMTASTTFRNAFLAALLPAVLTACIEQNDDAGQRNQSRNDSQPEVVVADQPLVGGESPTVNGGGVACESFRLANAQLSTRIDPGCTQCRVGNGAAAIDGDAGSAAQVAVNGALPSQGVALRATAQSGLIFPAGRLAGVIYSAPAGTAQNTMITISTFSGGLLQETTSSNNMSGIGGGRSRNFTGIRTSKPFDAVEVFINNTQAETDPTFQVFEFCSHHRQ